MTEGSCRGKTEGRYGGRASGPALARDGRGFFAALEKDIGAPGKYLRPPDCVNLALTGPVNSDGQIAGAGPPTAPPSIPPARRVRPQVARAATKFLNHLGLQLRPAHLDPPEESARESAWLLARRSARMSPLVAWLARRLARVSPLVARLARQSARVSL